VRVCAFVLTYFYVGLFASAQIPDSIIIGPDTYPIRDIETGALMGYTVYSDSTETSWKDYLIEHPIFYDDFNLSTLDTSVLDSASILLSVSTRARCKRNSEYKLIPCLAAYTILPDSFCHYYTIRGYKLQEIDSLGNTRIHKIVSHRFPDAIRRRLYFDDKSKFTFYDVLVEDQRKSIVLLSKKLYWNY
jgi:hypothetical protein